MNEIKCPYCGYVSEECDFPDLFFTDSTNTIDMNTQVFLLEELQCQGYNVVTCGNCGNPFIIKTKEV